MAKASASKAEPSDSQSQQAEGADQADRADQSDQTDQTDQADQADQTTVSEAALSEAVDAGDRAEGGQIDILLDTPMEVSACLGEVSLPVRELLRMGPGSVLTLEKEVGEPLDLYLRGIKFATGHLVVVGERLAVRIKEIISTGVADEN